MSAAGIGDAIRAVEPPKPQAAGMTDCCSEVLRRLDKLDDIAKMLQNLADQNAALQKELDALKQNQQVIESRVNQPVPQPPSADAIAAAIENNQKPKFVVLNVNAGGDSNGNVTFSGKGRFFAPFGGGYAFQGQAEYLAFHGQKEGQLDVGLVDRMGPFQAALFSSFKYVSISGNQNGGTLGQAALSLDYIFKYGKIGIFGTKGFMNEAVINRVATVLPNGIVSPDLFTETYLRVVDQVGLSGSVGMWGNNYLEGNAGFLKQLRYWRSHHWRHFALHFPVEYQGRAHCGRRHQRNPGRARQQWARGGRRAVRQCFTSEGVPGSRSCDSGGCSARAL